MSGTAGDLGLAAYQNIAAELESCPSPARTPRSGGRGHGPSASSSARKVRRTSGGGADVPSSPGGRAPAAGGGRSDSEDDDDRTVPYHTPTAARRAGQVPPTAGVDTPAGTAPDDGASEEAEDQYADDGGGSHAAYHDALARYLDARTRHARAAEGLASDASAMQVDGADEDAEGLREEADAELDRAEAALLRSLSGACDDRASAVGGDGGDARECDLWDLLRALRESGGNGSVFHGSDVGSAPSRQEVTLAADPRGMPEKSPEEALELCLGGEDGEGSCATVSRLRAAVGWIEGCHARAWRRTVERAEDGGDGGSDGPLLPAPRRRTMWPDTLRLLKSRPGGGAGEFHPDRPIRDAWLSDGGRSGSPVDVSSFLCPGDEADDARLLRSCLRLVQSGRVDEACRLASDCGQAWRGLTWLGGRPLSADGKRGNPRRLLWKNQCRAISGKMTRLAGAESGRAGGGGGDRTLYPSLAYEAAILSLLADDAESSLSNPALSTWEGALHALLRSEMGIIEEDVLRAHNGGRLDRLAASGGHFPFPGTETDVGAEVDVRGHDGDLGAALGRLASCPAGEEGSDPLRNGMVSFLVGEGAVEEYIRDLAGVALETGDEDGGGLLRFAVHLAVYADSALPGCVSRMGPPDSSGDGDDGTSDVSLLELLLLKYVAVLSGRRDLWPQVALYCSLLPYGDAAVGTYARFLLRVHSERERRVAIDAARRHLGPDMELDALRSAVREVVAGDDGGADCARMAGEDLPPAGLSLHAARMMRSVGWLCLRPEHAPDALEWANALLRRLVLTSDDDGAHCGGRVFFAPKFFVDRMLPAGLAEDAVEECEGREQERGEDGEDDAEPRAAGSVSLPFALNLQAEFASIEAFLGAHTRYELFLDTVSKTSPCHESDRLLADGDAASLAEREIASRMERNTFRQRKMGLVRIVVESASAAADALTEVLAGTGGWLVDEPGESAAAADGEDPAPRLDELAIMRERFLPRAVFMLHEVLDCTAEWLEQAVRDTVGQFGREDAEDMLLTLFASFDPADRSSRGPAADAGALPALLTSSPAAPGHWHKKALSLASVVANDGNALHETFSMEEMERFLSLMAGSHVSLMRCGDRGFLFDG